MRLFSIKFHFLWVLLFSATDVFARIHVFYAVDTKRYRISRRKIPQRTGATGAGQSGATRPPHQTSSLTVFRLFTAYGTKTGKNTPHLKVRLIFKTRVQNRVRRRGTGNVSGRFGYRRQRRRIHRAEHAVTHEGRNHRDGRITRT